MDDQIQSALKHARVLVDGTCDVCTSKDTCFRCLLCRALIASESENGELRAQVAAMQSALECMRPAGSSMTAECLNALIDAALYRHAEWCDHEDYDKWKFDVNSPENPVKPVCNCHLAALSDDVERGKELLGALKDKDRLDWLSGNWIVISPSGDENQSPNRWIVDAAWADTEASAAGTLREAIDMERGELAKLKGETK